MEDYPLQNIAPKSLIADPGGIADLLARTANVGNEQSLYWVRRLERWGVTDSLLADVERKVRGARIPAYLALDPKSKTFKWNFEWPDFASDAGPLPDRESMYALFVAWAISAGTAHKVKRCVLKECHKYFVGGPRAKWCSENCGSKHRVRKKRKLDKQRQML